MISIIVPCFHAERFLERLVENVENQSYVNWELMIVSNGKGQECQLEIANRLSASDTRITVIHTDIGGVSNARNLGIKAAKGDWLCFVDADDEISPNHLDVFAHAISPGVDFIEGGFAQIDINGKRSEHRMEAKSVDLGRCMGTSEYLEISDSLGNAPWHTLFRTDFIRENHLEFDVKFSMNEDRIFKQKAFLCAKRLKFIPMTGYVYHASVGSAMSRWHATVEESWKEYLDLKDEVKRMSGLPKSQISSQRVQMQYYLVWQYVWNMFKNGCPLSFMQKYKQVKGYMGNADFQKSCRLHDWSNDNIYYRLYHLCILMDSPLLTSMLFQAQHTVKQLLNRLKK